MALNLETSQPIHTIYFRREKRKIIMRSRRFRLANLYYPGATFRCSLSKEDQLKAVTLNLNTK